MLEFSASRFVELSHRFGLLLGQYRKNPDPDVLKNSLTYLCENSEALGLHVTHSLIIRLFSELAQQNPSRVMFQDGRLAINDAQLDTDRIVHHVETLYNTMISELDSIRFRAIPVDRISYFGGEWLSNTYIVNNFPTALRELQSAGRCFALGESTAAVFHATRALESGLGSLAKYFNKDFSNANWQIIIEQIESEIRNLGNQARSQQRIDDERFFGGAASHLYFVKNAWRNHVAHNRESYSDGEALSVINNTAQFIESLCPRLREAF